MIAKIGISIGYFFDIAGFLVLYKSGAFDARVKDSRAALNEQAGYIALLKRTREQLLVTRGTTITTDPIYGIPKVATTMMDSSSLAPLEKEIADREDYFTLFQARHEKAYSKWLWFSEDAPRIGVALVVFGALLQWWFSSFGAR